MEKFRKGYKIRFTAEPRRSLRKFSSDPIPRNAGLDQKLLTFEHTPGLFEGHASSVVFQRKIYKVVIPGLTRNPVISIWIPAFAGMTRPRSL
jgi:hypothetical protein